MCWFCARRRRGRGDRCDGLAVIEEAYQACPSDVSRGITVRKWYRTRDGRTRQRYDDCLGVVDWRCSLTQSRADETCVGEMRLRYVEPERRRTLEEEDYGLVWKEYLGSLEERFLFDRKEWDAERWINEEYRGDAAEAEPRPQLVTSATSHVDDVVGRRPSRSLASRSCSNVQPSC